MTHVMYREELIVWLADIVIRGSKLLTAEAAPRRLGQFLKLCRAQLFGGAPRQTRPSIMPFVVAAVSEVF